MHRTAAVVVSAMLLVAQMARAQPSGMPSDIEWKLAELGAAINPAEAAKLYAPLQETEPYQGIKVERDLQYGPDSRHALDVFAPDQENSAPRPVLMYVHGGAFTGGNKRGLGSPFYDNIVLNAARNSFVGVNITYRLAPQHQWPAGAEDVAAAVRWVSENIATHGGDPARVFLMGHSAGAVHVASYVAHRRFHGAKGAGLAGAIFLSGLYEFTKEPPGPPEKAYFGDDPAKLTAGSTLGKLPASPLPLMLVYAELDPPSFIEQAKLLNEALCKAGRCPRLVRLPKHNHMSQVYAINTPDTDLSDEIVAFVKSGK